jgi:hypothetical protein
MNLAKTFVMVTLLAGAFTGLHAASEYRSAYELAEAKEATSPAQFRLALLCGDLADAKKIGSVITGATLANVRVSTETCERIVKGDIVGLKGSVDRGDPETTTFSLQASKVRTPDEVLHLVKVLSENVWRKGGITDEPVAHADTLNAIKILMSRIVVEGLPAHPMSPVQFETFMTKMDVSPTDTLMRDGYTHEQNEPHVHRLQRVLDYAESGRGKYTGPIYGTTLG